VIVLHAPKKDVDVAFASSPSTYDTFNPNMGFISREDPHAEQVVQPGIEEFNHRIYLAVEDPETGDWGWLDEKWAIESGALDLYSFTDSSPRSLPFSPGKTPVTKLPKIQRIDKQPTAKDMAMTLDMNGKIRHLKPTNKIPKP
jgi:hypothetical protein